MKKTGTPYEKSLQETFQKMEAYALQNDLGVLAPEHLLYHLLENDSVRNLIENSQANYEKLSRDLTGFLNQYKYNAKLAQNPKNYSGVCQYSNDLSDIIARAEYASGALQNPKKSVGGIDLLLAFFAKERTHATQYLINSGFNQVEATSALKQSLKDNKSFTSIRKTQDQIRQSYKQPKPEPGGALKDFCINLTKKAEEGKMLPLIGRESELEQMTNILRRFKKSNPLLVGAPGVGKTAIVEGLAENIVSGNVPPAMKDDIILELDLGALVADTSNRGDFEKRIKDILDDLQKFEEKLAQSVGVNAGKPRVHLFVDEVHMLMGAGSNTQQPMTAANLLKPALANGTLSLIGATTDAEYRKFIKNDGAFSRRFPKIDVPEPTVAQSIEILKGLRNSYEKHHNVIFSDEALEEAVKLAHRFTLDNHLPDSAIDVIDTAAASATATPGNRKTPKPVDVSIIQTTFARMTRRPPEQISANDKTMLRTLEDNLQKSVFGQDDAINTTVKAIKRARASSSNSDKKSPLGSFLFTGSTGTGKTELARQLAENTGVPLIRLDMSEYMEKHTVSKLIGSPPGYTESDQGGVLIKAIQKNPHCVLLLDEIEKAHPDVLNILLQIMDYGTLTGSNGEKADFSNVMLLMTSNCTATEKPKNGIGFKTAADNDNPQKTTEAVKRFFTPEFRNRLDAIIPFHELESAHMGQIVDKFIKSVEQNYNIHIQLDTSARNWLAEQGYDRDMGARPMKRAIQNYIEDPVSDKIINEEFSKGGTVRISFNAQSAAKEKCENPLSFVYNKTAAKEQDNKPTETLHLPKTQRNHAP